MKIYLASISIFSFLLLSCSGLMDKNQNNESKNFTPVSVAIPDFARGFRIKQDSNIKLLEVFNPWDTTLPAQRFYLAGKSAGEDRFPDGETIEIPVTRLVCLSASQLSYLDALHEIEALVGVSNADYVVSGNFNDRVKSGRIKEVGIGDHFKIEELINLSPQVIFVSPQKGQSYQPLINAGLTVIPVGEYLESHPLGRAEWIKFVAMLFGKEQEASAIFDTIAQEYNRLRGLTENVQKRPAVITGKQYGGFWNMAGGNSYEACFLEDAGADYLWDDDPGTGGIMLDFETVYNRGLNADFWRFLVYSDSEFTYEQLQEEDLRYADFKAFKHKNIIICNTLKKPFFQKGFLEPQVILADYIHIFHPDLLPDHKNVYYELLK